MTWREEWTATAVSAAVREGSLTARDAVMESLSRIGSRDGELEAFQVVRTERAMAEAEALDARTDRATLPLAGVPVAIKDNVPVAGEPFRNGSAATDPAPQREDHVVVRRLRDAGAVVVGITRVPELCVWGMTDSAFAVTRNPWNPTRTPGGSSGGSAAAVASGMVPVAHAADGLGSIRIPAASTGLVGLKPGLGVVPAELGSNDWFGMSENGPLATTVADAALLLSVMAARPELAEVVEPTSRLRIALAFKAGIPTKLDPAHAAAVERVGALLRGEGHDVRYREISVPPTAAAGALARWFAGTAIDAEPLDDARLEPRTRTHARIGRAAMRTPAMAERVRTSWQARARDFLMEHDVLVSPVLAIPPIEARPYFQQPWRASWNAVSKFAPYAGAWNLAGFPAMSVPMGVHPDAGTPLSVQLVGRPGTEPLLLGVARTVERVRPWQRVAPAFTYA